MADLRDDAKNVWLLSKRVEELSIYDVTVKGIPIDGLQGTGVNILGKGSICIDVNTGTRYINAGTKELPAWISFTPIPTLAPSGHGIFRVAKFTYDQTLDGGAIGTRTPVNKVIIPNGAILTSGYFVPLTELESLGAATLAIGLIGLGNGYLVPARAWGDFNLIDNNNLLAWFTSSVVRIISGPATVSFTIAGAAITAGQLEFHFFYFLAGGV